ncbi:MAG: hypothetical protein R2774_13555 [Saprospiraceae bacterium]
MKFILILIGICFTQLTFSQVTVNLEVKHEINPIKFYVGENMIIKTKDFPNEWQKKKIERILVNEGTIVFEDALYAVGDITHVKVRQQSTTLVGHIFKGFAAGWIVFGGIASVARNYKISKEDIIIGTTSGVLGFLFGNILAHRVYDVVDDHKLRLVDVSMVGQ